jgi:sulfatase maturation enzyme AslB (radical SAM superfamily)
MDISALTFILTYDCNFKCSYCYPRKKSTSLGISLIKQALDFFLPHFNHHCYLKFTGGEPLLSWDKIEYAVEYVQAQLRGKKQITLCITTNGSLLTEGKLDFLEKHRFRITLSYDGLAQSLVRKNTSIEWMDALVENILKRPSIKLKVHSVFTPQSVAYLSDSLEHIYGLGINDVGFALAQNMIWDEGSLKLLQSELKNVRSLQKGSSHKSEEKSTSRSSQNLFPRIARCAGGNDRMAVSPEGSVWGCYMFAYYFSEEKRAGTKDYDKYCFGNLDSFTSAPEFHYAMRLPQYLCLGQDLFKTPNKLCKNCDEVEYCFVCPVNAAFTSRQIGIIPENYCRIARILRENSQDFKQDSDSVGSRPGESQEI